MGRGRPKKEKSYPTHPSFNEDQIQLIRSFKGILGDGDTEIVKNITLNWLLERTQQSRDKK